MANVLPFDEFLQSLQTSNRALDFFVDWQKCLKNKDEISTSLNHLNFLLGKDKEQLKDCIKKLFKEHPEAFNALNILIAVRNKQHLVCDIGGGFYPLDSYFDNDEKIYEFICQTGLEQIFCNKSIGDLNDFVLGIEVGLDSNARKNRSGKAMESYLSNFFTNAQLNFQEQVDIRNFKDLHQAFGEDIKKFDFVIFGKMKTYFIETNFYTSGGSKLNEVARSYQDLALKFEKFINFKFVWITDGEGWLSAKNKLQEAYKYVEMYNLSNICHFIQKIKNENPLFISEDELFELYQDDCNELLPQFEDTFDLIFADPPYFLSNDGLSIQSGEIVSVNKGDWDKEESISDIDEFNLQWISNAKKALKNTGSIMISGTYHNIFSLGRVLQKLDFKILNIITWQKTNPPPNFSCRYLTHSTEQIIWARKSVKHKHIFNYELLKKLNNDKQMRDVWSFPAIAPWEKANGKHPTQKPLNLLVRLILMASNQTSFICDPFSGSSTTGIAANLLGRKFIGIEKESEFIKISIDRKVELEGNIKKIKNKISDLKLLENMDLFTIDMNCVL